MIGQVIRRGTLCGVCHQLKPSLLFEYNGRRYCSQGCAAMAAWLSAPIPLQRKPSE